MDATKTIETATRDILQAIGDDPERPGIIETPKRVAKAYAQFFKGYIENPADHIKVFEEVSTDQMIISSPIHFVSFCEHHMLPFVGRAHIGYLPKMIGDKGRVLGISKLSRVVNVFASRLQIQERLTTQIADFLYEHLGCDGVGVVLQAQHMCMALRGVKDINSSMTTSAMLGNFREDPSIKSEFLSMINLHNFSGVV